ncbi:hypothetical protein N665_2185s0001 [Sinapis alba]|nr:hypothetical protein N665_2185s0001 [Sinapis alba]
MTKKTTEGTPIDMTELRTILNESQSASQSSIQQLGETLAGRLDALTTAITALVDQQNQRNTHAPPPAHQQHQPLPQPHAPVRHQQHHPPPPPLVHRQQHLRNQRPPYNEDEDDNHQRLFYEDLRRHDNHDDRWERGFRVDIPEFHGGLCGDELIDWLISVEEIMEFKQVPLDRRVSLVAMRFRGHAATWWKQLKTTRSRTGKAPINSWDKLTKHLRQTFLPHNYERTMYTKLQNLRQGNRSVDEYAEEFSLLLTRNEINDSQIQLVSRFIGGLRPQLQNSMDSANSNTPSTSTKDISDAAASTTKPTAQDEQQLRRSTRPNALRCYSCGEPGHRQTACPHATRRGLVLDDGTEEQDVYDSQEEDDQDGDNTVSHTAGDTGRLLVLRRACLTPVAQDNQWLRTNIFRSTCTIKDRICSFVIDSGSCRNVVSEKAVEKLGITREKHPAPYNLGWLNDTASIRITQRAIVPFSIGLHYKDCLYCDVALIDFCHLLLGRPWEFDRKIIHDGAKNTYSFVWDSKKIVLLPSPDTASPPSKSTPPTPFSTTPPLKSQSSSPSTIMTFQIRGRILLNRRDLMQHSIHRHSSPLSHSVWVFSFLFLCRLSFNF